MPSPSTAIVPSGESAVFSRGASAAAGGDSDVAMAVTLSALSPESRASGEQPVRIRAVLATVANNHCLRMTSPFWAGVLGTSNRGYPLRTS